GIFSFVGYAFASSSSMVYAFIVPGALHGLVSPSLNGIMSGAVPANSQGELQGGIASMSSLPSVIGPPLMTGTFASFTGESALVYFPGAPFLLATGLTLLALLLFLRAAPARH